MAEKIKLMADSTCDLSAELIEQYGIEIIPLVVTMGGDSYLDGVTVFPDDLYAFYQQNKTLPKTASISSETFKEHFAKWVNQGYSVICFTIGSGFSVTYANARLAAEKFPNVFAVDSLNLSTGIGLQVLRAAEWIARGFSAQEVFEKLQALRENVRASFVVDTLEFLWKGGRCSGVARLGANMLQLKPCISVVNGQMEVGKKYRGNLQRCLTEYVKETLGQCEHPDLSRIFITHSGMSDPELIELVRKEILAQQNFHEVLVTRAGSTVSTHCGPNTLGVLFIEE